MFLTLRHVHWYILSCFKLPRVFNQNFVRKVDMWLSELKSDHAFTIGALVVVH